MITDENKKLAQWAMDYAFEEMAKQQKSFYTLLRTLLSNYAMRRWTDCNRHRKAD